MSMEVFKSAMVLEEKIFSENLGYVALLLRQIQSCTKKTPLKYCCVGNCNFSR